MIIKIKDRLPPPYKKVCYIYETGELALHARQEDEDMTGHEPAIVAWVEIPEEFFKMLDNTAKKGE